MFGFDLRQAPPAMPHDQQAIRQTKRNRWDDEQIHRRDAVGMIVEKCFPSLGRRPSTRGHILGYAGLPNFDTELEQLSMNPWSSPERIADAHLADQLSYFERRRGPATTASRLPAPIQPKTRAMPTNNSVRLHERQRIANLWKQPIETNEYQVVEDAERESPRSSPPQNVNLLPQCPNLCLKRCPRPK
jgi:hypothetical protein